MLTPLSLLQRAVVSWIDSGWRFDFGTNISLSLRLQGPLCRPSLCRAVAFILGRHEALRMRLDRSAGIPQQYFIASPESYDLQALKVAGIDAAFAYVAERLQHTLDLDRAGPLHVELLALSERDHVLVLILHHIVTDAYADDLLISELLAAYEHFAHGRVPSLEPAMSISAFIAEEAAAGDRLTGPQVDYWRDIYRGWIPAIPARPPDIPAAEGPLGRLMQVSLTAAVTRQLEELATTLKVGLMAVVYAAMLIAVWKEYGLDDVCVTAAHSGRDSNRLKTLCACTTRMFLLRLVLEGGMQLDQVARRIHTNLFRGALSSRPPFSNSRALTQFSEGDGAGSRAQRVELLVVDAMGVGKAPPQLCTELRVERVIAGPLVKDPFEYRAGKDASAAADNTGVTLLCRRDLSPEPGRPLSFLTVFKSDVVAVEVIRSLLARVCEVAGTMTVGNQHLTLAQLTRQ